jgi:hypothetical protein
VSRFRVWRNRQAGEGSMRLTLLGMVAILGVVAVMVYIAREHWRSLVAE